MALYLGPNLISGVFTTYHTTTYNTSDGNATSADILSGKKAYVNGSPVIGTIPTKSGSDVTTSGATFTVPAGYYASAYTGSIANGVLRTPSYTTTASSGAVTVTYGVSTAGYLATSAPTWTFTPFTKRTSVVTTYGSTITPSTTSTKTITIPAGYYPTAETLTIAKAAASGSPVAVGSVSGSTSFVVSGLSFTPKGIFAILPNGGIYADDDINVYAFFAQNSTTATVCYSSGSSEGGTHGTKPLSATDGLSLISTTDDDGATWGDIPMSVLDVWLYEPISDWGVSGYYIGDTFSFSSSSVDGYTTTASVSYASGSVTVNLSGCYVSGTFYYVVWG